MKKNNVYVAASLGLVQLALLSTVAHAQDTTRALQNVTISTTKIGQKRSQTGKVTTVISRQELERSSGKSVAQLLNEQAGINVNGANGNPGLNKSIYLRGGDNKHTLILLDGVLVFDPSNVGGAFDLRLLSVDQIDHIEILRGGQSTLYGSDAVAGVINIITKKGGAEPSLNGVASAGSYATVKGNLGVSAQVKDVSYNINYSHDRSDGVSEAARPANSSAWFDKDGYSQNAVNAQFGIKATERFNINPFVRYLQGKYKYDDGGFTDATANEFSSKHLNLGTNATYQTNGGQFTYNYNYENTERAYASAYPTSTYIGRVHFNELYYKHQLSDHIKVLGGVDYRRTRMNAKTPNSIDSTANQFGAYASLFFNDILNVINLEGGGRFTRHTKFGQQWTYSVTPSFNLIKDDKLKVFGTVSTSFKAPDLSALYGAFGANPSLKPEKSQEFEAGASTAWFGRYNLRVVAYQRKLDNAIIYLYPQGYLNQDKQNIKGIEVEPSAIIGDLTLRGYYTFLKASTTTKAGTVDKTTDFLYRRPAHNFGLFAGYQATSKFFVSLNYRRISQRYDLFYNSATFGNELQSLAAYSMFDGYAEYSIINKRLKVFADVKNILNAKYADLYGYTALGTNFNAGLSFNIQ